MRADSGFSFDSFLGWLAHGYLDWSWWQILVFTLAATHITIAAVTIFLHRCQAHRALDLHPIMSHFFRFWLWLTTGMITKEWAAIHRKHHAKCETEEEYQIHYTNLQTKIKETIGWSPIKSIDEIVLEVIEYQKSIL